MSGGRTSGRARKSVNLARVRGSGRPEKVGRPVVPGALDIGKGRSSGGSGSTRDASFRTRGKMGILGSRMMRFRGWKVGKIGEMLDPVETEQIHGSNPTKLRQSNKPQKNWGYFWWGFLKLGRNTTKLG